MSPYPEKPSGVSAPLSNSPIDVAIFVDARVAEGNRILLQHIDRRFDELEGKVMAAFPGDDPRANREVLETIIRKNEAKSRFWEEMRITLARRGVLFLLIALAGAVWLGVKTWLLTLTEP